MFEFVMKDVVTHIIEIDVKIPEFFDGSKRVIQIIQDVNFRFTTDYPLFFTFWTIKIKERGEN